MSVLTPESKEPGAPVATSNPDHQPRVPTQAGVPPYCSCGFVGGSLPGTLLADHLEEHDPTYAFEHGRVKGGGHAVR